MSTSTEIIIVGAGRHGMEMYAYIEDMTNRGFPIRCVGFIDDAKPTGTWNKSTILGNLTVLSKLALQKENTQRVYITALGDNYIRQQIVHQVEQLSLLSLPPWTLVHPTAFVGLDVMIGEGTCVAPGSIVTTGVQVGRHCILNVKASISHDCVIGNYANLNPGTTVCGDVKIGNGCYIGAGATIRDKVSIGDWTIVGAGAVVISSLPAHVTAVGVPARIIKYHKKQ